MRDIGNCSMMGAIWWRAQNASIWSTTIGLPLGEPDTDLCCDISPKTATATGTGTTPTKWMRPFGAERADHRLPVERRVFTVTRMSRSEQAIFFRAGGVL